jgi:hypothetical protein
MKVIGSVYYDETKISLECIRQVYHVMCTLEIQQKELDEFRTNNLKESDITNMLIRQVELFTSAGTYPDYREILEQNSDESNMEPKFLLDKYLHQPLVDFIARITKTGKSKSNTESHKVTLKIQMIVFLGFFV